MVINKYHFGNKVPAGAVNIMRGGPWGNPFEIGKDGTREEVVEKHKRWLWERIKSDPEFCERLMELDGKDLCCCCAPKACHGDTLAKAARWLVERSQAQRDGQSGPESGQSGGKAPRA